jgi:hypothetical protein
MSTPRTKYPTNVHVSVPYKTPRGVLTVSTAAGRLQLPSPTSILATALIWISCNRRRGSPWIARRRRIFLLFFRSRRARSLASSCSRGPPHPASPLPDDSAGHRFSPGLTNGDPFPSPRKELSRPRSGGTSRLPPDALPTGEGDLRLGFASWELRPADGRAARCSSPSASRPSPPC